MKIWQYNPDSDHFQTLALYDHDRDAHIFNGHEFKHGNPFVEPLPKTTVVYEKDANELSPSQRRLALKGQLLKGDFPSLYGIEVIFSERALGVLLPLIQNSVQVISLHPIELQLYLIHVTNFVDCLDRSRSNIKWLTGFEGSIIFQVQHYVFHEEQLHHETIFKIPELFTHTYVTDTFKSAVEEHGLRGLAWDPLP
jgi:hypothetical protein